MYNMCLFKTSSIVIDQLLLLFIALEWYKWMIQVVISRQKDKYSAQELRPFRRNGNHDSCADNKLLTLNQFSILSRSDQRLFVVEQEPSSPRNWDVSHRGRPFISLLGCESVCMCMCVCVCGGGLMAKAEKFITVLSVWQKQAFLETESNPLKPKSTNVFALPVHTHTPPPTPPPNQHLCCLSLKMAAPIICPLIPLSSSTRAVPIRRRHKSLFGLRRGNSNRQ